MFSKLKELRMRKGLKQWVVAKKLGIHESLLSNIEVGRTKCPDRLKSKIARILEADPDELFEPEHQKQGA